MNNLENTQTAVPDEADQFIGAEGTEPAGEMPRTGEPGQRELEEMLDAALACTFPASDPIGCFTLCLQTIATAPRVKTVSADERED